VNIRKAAEDARDAGMIRAHVRIPDLLAVMDENDRYRTALEEIGRRPFMPSSELSAALARDALEQR
jgi:hypothetical protein